MYKFAQRLHIQRGKLQVQQAERYRPQLESYTALFAGERLPQRLAVLYVAHGILAGLAYNPDFD